MNNVDKKIEDMVFSIFDTETTGDNKFLIIYSVILFIITAVLSIFVFKYVTKDMVDTGAKTSKKAKKWREA